MTPTRAQYDAVLTRSSAGVRALSGDLDDDEDRNTALDWLENITRQARLVDRPDVCGLDRDEQTITAVFWVDADPDRAATLVREMLIATQPSPSFHESDEQGSDGTHGPREPLDGHTAPLPVFDNPPPPPGENWRDGLWWNGRYWQSVTQAWPPPAKGTHESDLSYGWTTSEDALIGHHDHTRGPGAWQEYDTAMDWSRSA